jgi:hypothetical protein
VSQICCRSLSEVMSGRGRGLGSEFRGGKVHSIGDFGNGREGGFDGWIESDDRDEIGEEEAL